MQILSENLFKTNLRISEGSNLTSEDYHKRAEQRKELDWLVFTVMPDSTEAQVVHVHVLANKVLMQNNTSFT